MGNTRSAVTVESLNVIILKIGGKRGFSSLLHVLQTSQSTVVQNLFGESNGLYDTNYKKKPRHFLGTAFLKKKRPFSGYFHLEGKSQDAHDAAHPRPLHPPL